MTEFLARNWYLPYLLVVAQYLLSAIVSSLDMPSMSDTRTYRFWFKFLNYLAANPLRAKAANSPSMEDSVIRQKVTTTKTTEVIAPEGTPDVETKGKDK